MSSSQKKLVSIYFDELQYLSFQYLSKIHKRNTADLIREAMDMYLKSQKLHNSQHSQNSIEKNDSFDDWEPLSVGGIKEGATDWVTNDYQDEMLGGSYDGEGL